MNLVDACEPVFQYVCALNRTLRKGGVGALRADQVRAEIKGKIAEAKKRADGELAGPFRDIEPVLYFFADSMVFAAKSRPAGYQPISQDLPQPELAFEARFWSMLDETMKEIGQGAMQKLAVYYTCIGLGFRGLPHNMPADPEFLRAKMSEIASKIRPLMDTEVGERLFKDAYHADTRDLTPRPSRSITGIVIAASLGAAAMVGAFVWMVKSESSSLVQELRAIGTEEAR
jgi:type VI secretion system protein ImpK